MDSVGNAFNISIALCSPRGETMHDLNHDCDIYFTTLLVLYTLNAAFISDLHQRMLKKQRLKVRLQRADHTQSA